MIAFCISLKRIEYRKIEYCIDTQRELDSYRNHICIVRGIPIMIDRARRKKMALHLHQYVSCRFNNQKFENRLIDDVTDGYLPEYYYCNPNPSQDPVIRPMLERIWFLYSDANFHRAQGRNAIRGIYRKETARYIVFLHSDLEYKWPPVSFANVWLHTDEECLWPLLKTLKFYKFRKWPNVNFLWNFLTRGRARKNRMELLEKESQEWDTFLKAGDYDYWPFISKGEYDAALKRPMYFVPG